MAKSKPNSRQPSIKSVGWDDIAEDLFGVNLRGLKTIFTIFLSPRRYFQAAHSPNWEGKYTPSLRIWLALIAIESLLALLPKSMISETKILGLKDIQDRLGNPDDIQAVAEAIQRLEVLTYPLSMVAVFMFLAAVIRCWGLKITYVVRLRLISVGAIIFHTLGVLLSTAAILQPMLNPYDLPSIPSIGLWGLGFVFLVLYWIYYRGAVSKARKGRLWRTAIIGTSIIIGYACALILSGEMAFRLAGY